MPKMKTKKAAAKRFSRTGSGKIKRAKAYRRHLLTHKSSKQKRGLRGTTTLEKGDTKLVSPLLPYKRKK